MSAAPGRPQASSLPLGGKERSAQGAPVTPPPVSTACELLVIGAGPAGLAAATRAAGLGLDTVLIDEQPAPGGQIYRAVSAAAWPAGASSLLNMESPGRKGVQLRRQRAVGDHWRERHRVGGCQGHAAVAGDDDGTWMAL